MGTQDRRVVIVTGAPRASAQGSSRDTGERTGRLWRRHGRSSPPGIRSSSPWPATSRIPPPRTGSSREALEAFGRIDTLVNNAGVYVSKPFVDYTAEDYAAVVGVNLTGFFRLTQLAIAHMLARGTGHVVNITTTLVDVADSSSPSALTALTKGGVAAATRSLAIEHASRGIRVNAVSPGIIQTPVHPPESYAGLGERLVPLGHVGQVDDVVNAILFLESSPFVTGEIVHVDGGQIAGH